MSDLGIFEKRQIKPRQVITRRGDPGKRVYLLLDGSVQTSSGASGSEVLAAGSMFGRLDLLTGEDGGAYAATTTALTDATLMFADATQLAEEIGKASPTVQTLLRTSVKALG
ncbi:MAG: cyclic nucleotide-binding domain-containing protein [Thalassobaculaceae bacterium]|nr:cyclic nucleotide-binding domain-containing protein [Thalassobaculaceae bacterium]